MIYALIVVVAAVAGYWLGVEDERLAQKEQEAARAFARIIRKFDRLIGSGTPLAGEAEERRHS